MEHDNKKLWVGKMRDAEWLKFHQWRWLGLPAIEISPEGGWDGVSPDVMEIQQRFTSVPEQHGMVKEPRGGCRTVKLSILLRACLRSRKLSLLEVHWKYLIEDKDYSKGGCQVESIPPHYPRKGGPIQMCKWLQGIRKKNIFFLVLIMQGTIYKISKRLARITDHL